MDVGDEVAVDIGFADCWARGYEIAAIDEDGYRLRRLYDGTVLPGHKRPTELREIDDETWLGGWPHDPPAQG
jgi:hypothetical protein